MKIIVASDSYKGCLSSAQVASAARKAILSVYPDAQVQGISVADGGGHEASGSHAEHIR